MKKTSLKITVAGIRGIIGESLTPQVALDFAEIFGTIIKGGTIVLGTDTRISTDLMKSAVLSGLYATGCKVLDIGVVATPTVQIMVKELKADGGIMLTASHNNIMWNGLKFISPKGIFLDEAEMQEVFKRYEDKHTIRNNASRVEDITSNDTIGYKTINKIGSYSKIKQAAQTHINKVLKFVDVDLIKKSNLKVVVDSCHGAGVILNPVLFKKLGIKVRYIGHTPDGKFSRDPEPLPENITELKQAVIDQKADIGFAQDADADRLAIVNEKGEAIGEDYTLVLTMKYLLDRHPNPKGKVVATNLSTTKAFADIAQEYEANVILTKIGEVNVSKALMDNDSIIGGEGNGGVIVPEIGYGRDSFAGMAFILEYLAKKKTTISKIVESCPKYVVVKKRKDLDSKTELESHLNKVKSTYNNETLDYTDGIKVTFKDSWLHVRASNTEPIIRYFAEAKTKEEAQKLIDSVF